MAGRTDELPTLCATSNARTDKWCEEVLGLPTYDYRSDGAAFMSADRDESHEVALTQVDKEAPGPQAGRVELDHGVADREPR